MNSRKDDTTREKLFQAAIKVFAQNGYKEATVREICKQGGSANINSVNYYFGSKELLYRAILESIFAEYDNINPENNDIQDPSQKLKDMITSFCSMLYKGDNENSYLTTIFINEMIKPSPFIEDLVDQYNKPRMARHMKIIEALLGEGAPEQMVRDCLVSISGQLLYYSFAWPVFSRLFPDCSKEKAYEKWADHVYSFSMAGINEYKRLLIENKGA